MLAFRILLHPLDPPSVIPLHRPLWTTSSLETEYPLTFERIFRRKRELASPEANKERRNEDNPGRKSGWETLAERICLAGGLIFIIRWDYEKTKAKTLLCGKWKVERRDQKGERRISELKTEKTGQVERLVERSRPHWNSIRERVALGRRIYIYMYVYTHIYTCIRVRERKRCARVEGELSVRRVGSIGRGE